MAAPDLPRQTRLHQLGDMRGPRGPAPRSEESSWKTTLFPSRSDQIDQIIDLHKWPCTSSHEQILDSMACIPQECSSTGQTTELIGFFSPLSWYQTQQLVFPQHPWMDVAVLTKEMNLLVLHKDIRTHQHFS